MSLVIHDAIEQRSDEWYDQRRGMVTASTVGRLITAKTIKVAANDESRGLCAQLTAERVTGWSDESTYVSADMQRGIDHEPIALEKYAEQTGATVDTVGFMVRDDWGYSIGYSPDGLVGDDGLVEVKCPRAKGHLTTIVSGVVPSHHMAQLQCGLLVSGRKWIDFVSFCSGMPMFIKRVHPDPRWQEAIVAAVAAFEHASAELASTYLTAVDGLPTTERIIANDLGLVFS